MSQIDELLAENARLSARVTALEGKLSRRLEQETAGDLAPGRIAEMSDAEYKANRERLMAAVDHDQAVLQAAKLTGEQPDPLDFKLPGLQPKADTDQGEDPGHDQRVVMPDPEEDKAQDVLRKRLEELRQKTKTV